MPGVHVLGDSDPSTPNGNAASLQWVPDSPVDVENSKGDLSVDLESKILLMSEAHCIAKLSYRLFAIYCERLRNLVHRSISS
ncbi:hypothetical protein AVEN_200523-1 [Araneus ventricosus]|uniref:Uncharacterized protein n=1 Tax=Araneus ventricosus TaxID=182803 RepID=A0A4Y2RQZ6_ARAVE|nr:hypothetical protein AVEN_200523-1 [Araneus ventricosus]